MRAIDIVRRLCPRAHPNYVAAFERGDQLLAEARITSKLRLAHFMAQVFHETGGLTILRESGRYSAKRIMEIFGVGKHSAAVTKDEAEELARKCKTDDGYALFERVYGLGNPRKAAELGNTKPGDGSNCRGTGPIQMTGAGDFKKYGRLCDVDFYGHPELAASAEHCLKPALYEWGDKGCNALADRNDIRSITRAINGGRNGLADRIMWFDKVWAILKDADMEDVGAEEAIGTSWEAGQHDLVIRKVQEDLVALGYQIEVDGRIGKETEKAIRAFQKAAGIPVDGDPGDVTRAALRQALERTKATRPDSADPALIEPDVAIKGGGGGTVLSAAGERLADQAHQIEPLADYSPWIRGVFIALMVASVALVAYGILRPMFKPKRGATA